MNVNLKIENGIHFIASQQYIECVYDTIQNILMFADGYRQINAVFAERCLQTMPGEILNRGDRYKEEITKFYGPMSIKLRDFLCETFRRYCLVKLNELGKTIEDIERLIGGPLEKSNIPFKIPTLLNKSFTQKNRVKKYFALPAYVEPSQQNFINFNRIYNERTSVLPKRIRRGSINETAGPIGKAVGLNFYNECALRTIHRTFVILKNINSLNPFLDKFTVYDEFKGVKGSIAFSCNFVNYDQDIDHQIGIVRYRDEYYIVDNQIGIAIHIPDIQIFNGKNLFLRLSNNIHEYIIGDTIIYTSTTTNNGNYEMHMNKSGNYYIYLNKPPALNKLARNTLKIIRKKRGGKTRCKD